MTLRYPLVLIAAVLVTAAAVVGYLWSQRRRAAALAAAGLTATGGGRRMVTLRRHLPYAVLLAALPILLTGLARPQADLTVPRVAGTVLLAFDVSNSMTATDVAPNRLAAAQAAAVDFVRAQPDTVDVGVLPFGAQALLTQEPTDDHAAAIAAVRRLRPGGGTSLGQAILVGLGAITGRRVALPEGSPGASPGASPPSTGDLGYWPSATMVIFSDGQETGGPDVTAAAELAAAAGVRIQTVGVGTTRGATVEVDGFQLGTALDEATLTAVAGVTGGAYHPAGDADALAAVTAGIDLRLTGRTESIELTGPFAGVALLLLTVGALLGIRWQGRVV